MKTYEIFTTDFSILVSANSIIDALKMMSEDGMTVDNCWIIAIEDKSFPSHPDPISLS